MPTFVMLSTLGPDGAATLRENPERLKQVTAEVESMGVHVREQFASIGPYDFCNSLEAPDETTIAKVALVLGARGTLKTLTLTAIPVDEFIARCARPEPRPSYCRATPALLPPEALAPATIAPHLLGGEGHGQHRAVGEAPEEIPVLRGAGDLEAAGPGAVEAAAHLDARARLQVRLGHVRPELSRP